MIRVGIAGIGFMGMIHFLALKRLSAARVSAIATRDSRKRSGDWTMIRGNFGPPGVRVDLTGITVYESWERMIHDPEIDLVDLCTPTDQHAAMAIAALAAGKHVLVEKPIALNLDDADRMLAAAEAAGRLLLVGHVLPFFPEFRTLADACANGRYGRLVAAQFSRIISRPDWSAAIADVTRTGGPAIDLHIHDTHFIRLLTGLPRRVFSVGREENGAIMHVSSLYRFDGDGPAIGCSSGALCQSARPFMHGFEAYFENATLIYQSGVQPLTCLLADGSATVVPLIF